jgi:hypothetical protein
MMVSQQGPIRSEADYEKARAQGRVWGCQARRFYLRHLLVTRRTTIKKARNNSASMPCLCIGAKGRAGVRRPSKQTHSAQSQRWEMQSAYPDYPDAKEDGK